MNSAMDTMDILGGFEQVSGICWIIRVRCLECYEILYIMLWESEMNYLD